MRSEHDVNQAIALYADTVQRICLYHLKNAADSDDVFQNVFLKYMMYDGTFDSEEHRKAWIIRVTINACTDFIRVFFRQKEVPLQDYYPAEANQPAPEQCRVLQAVLSLPARYKDSIYLHYYEGYSVPEISRILKKKENTIYSLLSRGRNILKDKLGGDGFDE